MRDLFRLGKVNRSSSTFRIKRLFIREDLPLELRQQKTSKAESSVGRSGDQQLAYSSFPETSSDSALLDQEHITFLIQWQ